MRENCVETVTCRDYMFDRQGPGVQVFTNARLLRVLHKTWFLHLHMQTKANIHLLLSLRYLALGAAGMSQRVSNKWQRTICIKDPWSMSLIGNNRPKAEHHQRFSSDAQQEALSHDTRVLRKRSLLTPWKTCQSITSPIHSKYSKYIFWKEQRIDRTKSCTKPTPTKGVTLGRIF